VRGFDEDQIWSEQNLQNGHQQVNKEY
jgi:hypothetical protein